MVYVPILKIELPEPSIAELIPATVRFVVNAATAVYDSVDTYLRPVPVEEAAMARAVIMGSIPIEFRRARKRLAERGELDTEKISEELEDAGFAFYRRRMREAMAGYSDEEPADTGIRRLADASSTTQQVMQNYLAELDEGLSSEELAQQQRIDAQLGITPAEAAAALAASCSSNPAMQLTQQQQQQQVQPPPRLPRSSQTVLATTAAGGAGLALGVGALHLVKLIRRLTKPRRPKGKSGAASGGSSRQRSQQASPAPSVSGQRRPAKRSSGTGGKGGGAQRSRPAAKKR
jgi:hypothetical protein